MISMPIFICSICKHLENTGNGYYWGANFSKVTLEHPAGTVFCSQCAPIFHLDGGKTGFTGEWHGKYPRREWDGLPGDYHNLSSFIVEKRKKKPKQKKKR